MWCKVTFDFKYKILIQYHVTIHNWWIKYLILSYLVLSCLVLSCLVLSCLVLSCLVLSYLFLSMRVFTGLLASLGKCLLSPNFKADDNEYITDNMNGITKRMIKGTCSSIQKGRDMALYLKLFLVLYSVYCLWEQRRFWRNCAHKS